MWAEWAAKSNKANVGRLQKKVKNGKARGKNNSNVGENTKKLKQKINAKKLVKMWGSVSVGRGKSQQSKSQAETEKSVGQFKKICGAKKQR